MNTKETPIFEYVSDPQSIYELSFKTIQDLVNLSAFPESIHPVIIRMIHSCGIPEITQYIVSHEKFHSAASRSLAKRAPIIVDSNMLKSAILKDPSICNPIICTLDLPDVRLSSQQRNITRSAASVDLWKDSIDGAIVVIGNAPTALFRLLECLLRPDFPKPAAIIATPVGFVGAAESKEALIQHAPVPFITLRSKMGGSAIAAGAINALIRQHIQGTQPCLKH